MAFIGKRAAQGKAWLKGDILDGWRKMPKPFSEYGYDSDEESNSFSKFIDDVIKLIDPEIDFSKHYDGLIVFRAGKKWNYDWSTLGKREFLLMKGCLKCSLLF